MADGVPIPPWLHGISAGEVGTLYERGMSQGLQVQEQAARMSQEFALQQQKLEQQRQMTNMQLELDNRRLSEQHARSQQQLEMMRQYHDQMTEVNKMRLQEAQQRVGVMASQAANKFAAQQRLKERIAAAGGDDAQIRQAILEEGPAIGGMGSEMSTALKGDAEGKQYGEPILQDIGGGTRLAYRPGSPGVHVINPQREHEATAAQLATIAKELPMLQARAEKEPKSLEAQILSRIKKMVQQPAAAPAAAEGAPVVPPKAEREVGKVYHLPGGKSKSGRMLPAGNYRWTGDGWAPVRMAPVEAGGGGAGAQEGD